MLLIDGVEFLVVLFKNVGFNLFSNSVRLFPSVISFGVLW